MRYFLFLILIFTSSASAASVASVKYVDECVATKVSKLEDANDTLRGKYDVKGTLTVPTQEFPTLPVSQ